MENINLLSELAEKIGVSLSEQQIKQFNRYYDMLIEKNKVMNLTAITDYEEVIYKHFIDSLSLIKVYDISQQKSVLDMGTGAGFPGIPLKIAFPSLSVTLLDSLNKRVVFLSDVIADLDLVNIRAVHGRAEDFGKNPDYRENFDLCVSRAVAKLTTLAEYCIPYIKKEGYFIPYKSGNIEGEVEEAKKAIKVLGGNLEKVAVFQLPETDIERSFVVIKKNNITPKRYPRTAGKPVKEPIN
ncbi:ribosomal RNA small subunit methyltransferase G [Anaerocolumna cellulosilytica]|uniref:Ribosomal RNA small subunit methyltransferase G n=1 Tax=Anaerocolumna cellulosilytica TaxID=433286 RepID=A0A6S6RCJ1_9FIRM|nr:16S rRNA (guanine(527)-N(7))-methyltransferase RsmG [Anaerocolumna cellulosilytica]MBB5195941.1 16S rRNA (guanine527-N7)-methyltransferase [Anaerocolumna cellulosilytica]BCJ96952.1 ribosomal RNA small subunit methyltransferase G [Anaerocolumna cellulosilytica]